MLDGHFILLFIAFMSFTYSFIQRMFYPWIRFVIATIQSKSSRRKVCIVGVWKAQVQAFVSFPFWGYIGILSHTLAVKHRDTCVVAQGQGQGTGQLGVWWEFPGFRNNHLLSVSSHGRGARELSRVSFLRTLIQIIRAQPHDLITSPRLYSLLPFH